MRNTGSLKKNGLLFIVTVDGYRGEFASVPPNRFRIFNLATDQTIRDFVEMKGRTFATGRGFYEFTKPELIQERKEAILMNNKTGEMFSGALVRKMIGLPFGKREKISPPYMRGFSIFVQSTSYNRRLKRGTRFLYEAGK